MARVNAKKVEKKIADTKVPAVKKVALAYSGGLDSTLAVELLRRKFNLTNKQIVPINVDVGQGKEDQDKAKSNAKILKIKPIYLDARKEFVDLWLTKAIRANSDYNGYPCSTSMTRQLIARLVAQEARKHGCDAVMEGSTGKGNDQYRMHNTFMTFAPELTVLCPVRDFDLTRAEEESICKSWGIPVDEMITGGDDKTMWCRSIASGAVDLNQELPAGIWMWLVPPEKARKRPEKVTIEFVEGLPVKLNGKKMLLDKLVDALNVIAGRNGIGRIDMFEDGIVGLKSREIYEAPGAHVILKLHHDLEQACLTSAEVQFKKSVDNKWAQMVYGGEWYHPLKEALDAFVSSTQKVVNATYVVKLYKGNIEIAKRELPTSLFSPEIRSIKSSGFDQRWSHDAAKIRGIRFEILAKRKQIMRKWKKNKK
jgi:argininosuccinate synthase